MKDHSVFIFKGEEISKSRHTTLLGVLFWLDRARIGHLSKVPPVSADRVIRCVKNFKSKSFDIHGISVFHLHIDSKEMIHHLQLLFQMCLCMSLVPDSFLCRMSLRFLNLGKIRLIAHHIDLLRQPVR